MSASFNIISYLAGMTGFVFDREILFRVALDCNVDSVTDYTELTQEDKDKCRIALLETVLVSPHSTASQTNEHGGYRTQTGSQSITEAVLENVKSELRKLYDKYDMQDELDALNDMSATLQWME